MFFDRPNNIYIFYTTTITYILGSLFYNFKNIFNTKQPLLIRRFFVFLLFAAISILWSLEPMLSKQMIFRLSLILILLLLTYYNNIRCNLFKFFIYALTAGLIINFISFFIFRGINIDEDGRFSGTLSNSNILAIIGVFSIFFYSLYVQNSEKKSAFLFTVFLGISLFLIMATGSRKGLVLGSFITLFSIRSFAQKQKQYYFILLVLLPVLLLYIIQSGFSENIIAVERLQESFSFFKTGEGDSSTKWRLHFIDTAYNVFRENMAFGVGIDAFQHFTTLGQYAHNNYLEILADLGVIGFLLYYSIYFPIIVKAIKQRKNGIFVAMIIAILIMEVAVVTYYTRIFWIFMFFFYEKLSIHKKKK